MAVIACFLNEGAYLPAFLQSLGAQRREPDVLLLVDDGSTDDSLRLAEEFARAHPYARVLSRGAQPRQRDRLARAAELEAFCWAVEQLPSEWDVVAKLDADLRLSPETLAELERRLAADPGLGIVGAFQSIVTPDGRTLRELCPTEHVRGSTKFYRRACFEEVYPLAFRIGWDTVDEVSARMHGWRTRSYAMPDGDPIHMRPTATADGALRGYRRLGTAAYAYGATPWWTLLAGLRRMWAFRPRILGGLSYLLGFSIAALRSDPRVDAHQRAFLAREQKARLRRAIVQRARR